MNRSRLKTLGALVALWGLVAVMTAGALAVELHEIGRPVDWRRMLTMQLLQWEFWAVATPAIVWLGRRVRIERGRVASGVVPHLLASVAFGATHVAWIVLVAMAMRPEGIRPLPFWQIFLNLGYTYHIELLTYWAILGVSYAFEYHRKFQERDLRASELETQLANAQLQALRAQLQPHFLFNALHGIAGLVRNRENEAAVGMIVGLSDLLRHALENAGEQEILLRHEIDFVQQYLDIQRMRFSDRLAVTLDVAPETLDAYVPNLILQPIVENAVRHGIARSASARAITVRTYPENGRLHLDVLDDGPGLAPNRGEGNGGGVGLANTRDRLERLYGEAFDFEIRNRDGGGAETVIAIPLRYRADARKGADAPRED